MKVDTSTVCSIILTAVIPVISATSVKAALTDVEVFRLTVMDCQGFGRQKGQSETYRGAEYHTNMMPKVKVEIAVADELADRVCETIQQAANTESIGDGKLFVLDLAAATRIRTGETGDNAL